MARRPKNRPAPGIEVLEDGRYKIRVSPTDPLTNKRVDREMTLEKGHTLGQAIDARDAFLARVVDELQGKVIEKQRVPTFADYGERWIKRKAARVRQSTLDSYMTRLAHHIAPVFGETRLDAIERPAVLAWRDDLEERIAKKKVSLPTARGWWMQLTQMLRDACADYSLPDPTLRIEGPVGRHEPKRETRTLSAKEVRAVAEAAIDSRSAYGPLVAVLALTGMRRGEGIALRWRDVNFKERLATVARSATWDGAEWAVHPPKNGRPRVVGLMPWLVEALDAHRQELVRKKHPGLKEDLVAPAPNGDFANYRALRQLLDRLADRVGLEQALTAQVLRRSYNTLALGVVDRVVAQAIIGHADDAMSAHYLGLRGETIREAADAIWTDTEE